MFLPVGKEPIQRFLFRLVGLKTAQGVINQGIEHIVFILEQPVVHLPGQTGLPTDVTDGDIVVIILKGQPQESLLQNELIFCAFFGNTKLVHNNLTLPVFAGKSGGLRSNRNHVIPGQQGRRANTKRL